MQLKFFLFWLIHGINACRECRNPFFGVLQMLISQKKSGLPRCHFDQREKS